MPKMTFRFTVAVQLAAVLFQYTMSSSADLFGWSPKFVAWLKDILSALQAAQGILAHTVNRDGTKPSEVPVSTLTREVKPSGEIDTKLTVETASRKTE